MRLSARLLRAALLAGWPSDDDADDYSGGRHRGVTKPPIYKNRAAKKRQRQARRLQRRK